MVRFTTTIMTTGVVRNNQLIKRHDKFGEIQLTSVSL